MRPARSRHSDKLHKAAERTSLIDQVKVSAQHSGLFKIQLFLTTESLISDSSCETLFKSVHVLCSMDKSSLPDLEGYFEPIETEGGHLSGPQLVPEEIAQQELRKTYWRLSFERVQFGRYFDQHAGPLPACLIAVEARFAPEDQERHRFTKVKIGLSFEGEDKGDIKVQRFAPEYARGVTVPGIRTSNWAIRYDQVNLDISYVSTSTKPSRPQT